MQTHSELNDAVVFDLGDVPLIDTTITLAIENIIRESLEKGKDVYVVKPAQLAEKGLIMLTGIIANPHVFCCNSRSQALRLASMALTQGNKSLGSTGVSIAKVA